MFRIKQRYIDPLTKSVKFKDIIISLDERRLETSSNALMEPVLLAYTNDKDGEDTVYINPTDALIQLLDTKRTMFMPPGNMHTYLIKLCAENSSEINVFAIDNLHDFLDKPVVIMSDIYGTNLHYAIVTSVRNTILTLSHKVKHAYYAGAIVQNISDRWCRYPLRKDLIGIKAKFSRPDNINFSPKYEDGMIKTMLYDAFNTGVALFYDLYVRNENFSVIEPHWIPDVNNVPIGTLLTQTNTYNGGYDAGGGNIEHGTTYYVGIVTKDGIGRININESRPLVAEIKL